MQKIKITTLSQDTKKLYNGISGLGRIVCAGYVGYLSLEGIYYLVDLFILARDVGSEWLPLKYLLLMLGFSMLIGQAVRGIIQLLATVKPQWENKAVAFVLDAAMVLFGTACYFTLGDIFENLYYLSVDPNIGIWFWIVIALALLDAIVMLVCIRRERIKVSANRLTIVRCFSALIIPVLVFSLGYSIRDMILDNLELIRINTAAQGGFDSVTFYDLDGNEYTEDLLRGHKVTMVNIWSTYCGSCIREMPELDEISRSFDPADFQIVGIPGDLYPAGEIDPELVDTAKEIVEATGVTYPILIPTAEFQSAVIDKVVFVYPTTLFVNEKGEELRAVVSSRQKITWIDIIEEVIAGEK